VLVILVQGVTSFLIGATNLTVVPSAGNFRIPGLASIPLIGSALFNQPWSFYAIYLVLPAVAWALYRTRWGLEVRASSENPGAARVSGVDVGTVLACAIFGAVEGAAVALPSLGVTVNSQLLTAARHCGIAAGRPQVGGHAAVEGRQEWWSSGSLTA